jgi:hypothetical protein
VQKYKKIIAPIEGKILEVFTERFGMKAGITFVEKSRKFAPNYYCST